MMQAHLQFLADGQPQAGLVDMIGKSGPIIIMIFVFYFVLIRPQQKKAKEHENLLKTLKAGDKVLTSAGILGVVVSVKEKSVTLRSADAKMEMQKSAVTEIVGREGDSTEKPN